MPRFAFNPRLGAFYARSFALMDNVPEDERLFYYEPNDDCTNFVSQCVWAAYGGWIPGFTDEVVAANLQRIRKNIRQTGGVWYGSKSHIGSDIWCRVGEFYSYTIKNKEKGPASSLVAEGSFQSVDPTAIQAGDVAQMVVANDAPDRYGHSLYVTHAGNSWGEILVCCHTANRLDAPMSEFALLPEIYTKMRVLRFFPAFFDG